MYKIIFYKNEKEISELENYINELQRQSKNKNKRIKLNKIVAYIDQLSENGLKLGEPYIKYLESDIWELRPLRDRIFLSCINKDTFILLNHFMKQTQKTPQREIEKAKRLLKEYKERNDLND